MTLLILFVVLAIGVSFLCSILEAVLLSITPSFVEAAEEDRPKLAGKLRRLRADIERPLTAILSLNTIAHTVGATGAGAQAALVFDDFGVGVFSAFLTLGILILSEIVPKTLGATYWRALAPFAVRVLPWLITVQLPLVWMSQAITRLLTRGEASAEISREEITALTSAGQRLGVVEEDETRVVANLFRMPEIQADEVMTPRTVIDHVAADATVASAVAGRDAFTFSRILVSGETIDEVRGFVLARELLFAALRGEGERPVADFTREMLRVPEKTDLDTLFDLLMDRDAHIALVEDEYGGTAGLVTMEDVLETLLGTEIVDEHDQVVDLRKAARLRAKQRREPKEDAVVEKSQDPG
ncbi:CNNM domain-containing protein [Hoeflea prorocentri]|uniref:Hemolysin family protein n=1 Tax=Hoeflea prorocentri TaxID=1922333 RepID=A0A9X3ZIX3_9HYPH|nr:hemolysin family protein [Hoeflea prorocentri]MCY6382874.1 hemolysin family protein [Hoeflea prorocentri]MDA5400674.1 hemolysin family protein [Hoeflea prorocentri]